MQCSHSAFGCIYLLISCLAMNLKLGSLIQYVPSQTQADLFISVATPRSFADSLSLFLLTCVVALVFTKGFVWARPDHFVHVYFERPQLKDGQGTGTKKQSRNVAVKLEEHVCVIQHFTQYVSLYSCAQYQTGQRSRNTFGKPIRNCRGLYPEVVSGMLYEVWHQNHGGRSVEH